MAKTEQGNFDITYHHIDAPTTQDEQWFENHKSRKLINPKELVIADRYQYYRSQELAYLADSPWFAWRKLDGQNLRVYWNGEQALWNGKSNKFTCEKTLADYMNETFAEELFEEKFGRDKEVVLFGEHMGPKVQGNELGLDKDEFVLYDVLVNDIWLTEEQIKDIAKFFMINTPESFGETIYATLEDMINSVSKGLYDDWEGIVATPTVGVRDRKGNRIIVKIKNKDYNKEK